MPVKRAAKSLMLSAGEMQGLSLTPKQKGREGNAIPGIPLPIGAELGVGGRKCKYGRRADGYCNDPPYRVRVDTLVIKHIGNIPSGQGVGAPVARPGGATNVNVVAASPRGLIGAAKGTGRGLVAGGKILLKAAPVIAGALLPFGKVKMLKAATKVVVPALVRPIVRGLLKP